MLNSRMLGPVVDSIRATPQSQTLLFLRGTMGSGKSSVAASLQKSIANSLVLEVDHMKETPVGGDAPACDPSTLFPAVGRAAASSFSNEKSLTVIVEPLVEQSHIQWILDPFHTQPVRPQIRFVWLECSMETAVKRKCPPFARSVIEVQYSRYESRFVPRRELIVNTDAIAIPAVVKKVVAFLAGPGQPATLHHGT